MAERIKDLLSIAQRNKERGYHDAARAAMRQAQEAWTPDSGVARPEFTDREQRELNLDQIEKLVALAQQNGSSGWESGEIAAIRAAHDIWERLHPPRPPEPLVTPRDGRRVRINWTPSHLSYFRAATPFDCPICLESIQSDQLGSRHNMCGHQFCGECMQKWTEMAMTCPMCRRDL